MESALYGFYSLVVSYNKTHSLAKPRSFVLLYLVTTREYKVWIHIYQGEEINLWSDLPFLMLSLFTRKRIEFF